MDSPNSQDSLPLCGNEEDILNDFFLNMETQPDDVNLNGRSWSAMISDVNGKTRTTLLTDSDANSIIFLVGGEGVAHAEYTLSGSEVKLDFKRSIFINDHMDLPQKPLVVYKFFFEFEKNLKKNLKTRFKRR